ncbi:GP5 [Olivier's shrew virus 2]|nr:GP5 [Olivier's shrew virus 2]
MLSRLFDCGDMKCLNNSARPSTWWSALPFFFIFLWCGGVQVEIVGASNTTSHSLKYYLIHNITLCELNTTALPGGYSFTYVEEYWVIAPFICYIIGFTAKTLSLSCDLLVVGPLFGVAAHMKAYYLMVMLIPTSAVLLGAWLYQIIITFMTWRHACTRHTSFVRSSDGQLGKINSHVLLVKGGKALTSNGWVKPDLVVLKGRKAVETHSVPCDHYA